MEFVEPEDEPGRFSLPLPPDDRLWRHPSEVGSAGPLPPPREPVEGPRTSMWMVAAISAVSAGLIASGMVMVLVGIVGSNDVAPVVEKHMEPRPFDAVNSSDVVDVAARTRPAVAQLVHEATGLPTASGVVFRSDGHVLTSASVLGTAPVMRAVLDGGQAMTARVVGVDLATDTAVLKLAGDGPFPVVTMGTSSDLQVGEQAIAVGWHPATAGASVAVGVISALHRTVDSGSGRALYDMVQTDVRVPPGWPGGALVDASGSVVGVISGAATAQGGEFGFAVPIEVAHRVAEEIVSTGRAHRPWLGVKGNDLDVPTATELGVAGGVLVGEVKPASPAEKAGLAPGDVIVEVDGAAVPSMGLLVVELRRKHVGDTVVLDVVSGGRRISVSAVLDETPPSG